LFLARNELLQANDVIPLEIATFLPTQRAQVAMMLKQLYFFFTGKILSVFPAFHQQEKHLRRGRWQALSRIFHAQSEFL